MRCKSQRETSSTLKQPLFFTKHILIATDVSNLAPEWYEVFSYSRKIVGAEIQNITFSEFLPIVLGPNTMDQYSLNLPEDVLSDDLYSTRNYLHTNPTTSKG